MDYWTILVLAAVRLGCNLDYDKLRDLAEQHRTLRLMMGLGDWQGQRISNHVEGKDFGEEARAIAAAEHFAADAVVDRVAFQQ